jgi:hypothetical protein
MIGPPSLSFNVGRSRWQTATGCLLIGLGALTVLAMGLNPNHFSPLAVASAVFAWGLSGWVFYRTWRNAPVGRLHWDGTHWHWADSVDYSVERVGVAMDLQRWVLVRLARTSAPPMWLWLEHGSVSHDAWIALRRALVYAARQPLATNALTQDGAYP